MQNFFAKVVQSASFCLRLSKELKKSPMTGSRSKYRFSRVEVKQGIQTVCLRTQAVGVKAPL